MFYDGMLTSYNCNSYRPVNFVLNDEKAQDEYVRKRQINPLDQSLQLARAPKHDRTSP